MRMIGRPSSTLRGAGIAAIAAGPRRPALIGRRRVLAIVERDPVDGRAALHAAGLPSMGIATQALGPTSFTSSSRVSSTPPGPVLLPHRSPRAPFRRMLGARSLADPWVSPTRLNPLETKWATSTRLGSIQMSRVVSPVASFPATMLRPKANSAFAKARPPTGPIRSAPSPPPVARLPVIVTWIMRSVDSACTWIPPTTSARLLAIVVFSMWARSAWTRSIPPAQPSATFSITETPSIQRLPSAWIAPAVSALFLRKRESKMLKLSPPSVHEWIAPPTEALPRMTACASFSMKRLVSTRRCPRSLMIAPPKGFPELCWKREFEMWIVSVCPTSLKMAPPPP